MTLGGRLATATTALVLAAAAILGLLAVAPARIQIEAEVASALAVAAGSAEHMLAGVERSPDPYRRLAAAVRSFDGHRHLQAAVVDAAGRVSEISRPERGPDEAPEWFVAWLAPSMLPHRIELPAVFGQGSAFVLLPEPHREAFEIWTIGLGALAALVSLWLAIMAVVVLLAGRGLRPLRALEQAAASLAEGRRSDPPPPRGPREVRRLARAHTRMVEALAEDRVRAARLREQMAAVQEEERADLARDIHDEVGPFLFAIEADALALGRLAAADPPHPDLARSARELSDGIRQSAGHARRQVKAVLGKLRSSVVQQLGLPAAIDDVADFWRARRPEVVFDIAVAGEGYGPTLDGVAHTIVREAVNNALRHAAPGRIAIEIAPEGDWLRVRVADDGGGLRVPKPDETGYGLLGLRERVDALGGRFVIENLTDRPGVRLAAWLPLPKGPAGYGRAEA